MGVEEERKFDVDPAYALPELAGCLPPGGRVVARDPVILTARYYDTADLRLARAGATLRYRREAGPGRYDRRLRSAQPADGRGDRQPWTVKLPTGVPGVRHEISRSGEPDRPPAELVALVTALTRGAPLAPVVVVQSRRRRYELCDADGAVLAELADDTVSVRDDAEPRGGFRELEVERVANRGDLLDRVAAVLTGAGAVAGGFTPKLVRALTLVPSRRATVAAPPDLPPPEPPGPQPTGGDVLRQAIRRSAARIVAHDPLVRLRQNLPDGDTPVHQLRVGLRRLRSDLRTFGALVDPEWGAALRRELRWLAGKLGAVRDAEVLRARLRRTATDPAPPVDPDAVARIDAALAVRERDARTAVDRALGSGRYLALLDALVAAARQPRLTALAAAPAGQVLPRLVAGPWWALRSGDHGDCGDAAGPVAGAADLAPDGPDEQWHAVRVRGKRARYAVEAVADAVGGVAPQLSRKLAAVQDLLGEHQDAAIAGQTWLDIAGSEPDNHRLAVAAGQLYERERAAVRRVRAAFPAAWRAADRPKLQSWLP